MTRRKTRRRRPRRIRLVRTAQRCTQAVGTLSSAQALPKLSTKTGPTQRTRAFTVEAEEEARLAKGSREPTESVAGEEEEAEEESSSEEEEGEEQEDW